MAENEAVAPPDEVPQDSAPQLGDNVESGQAAGERETQAAGGAEEFLPTIDVALPESETASPAPPQTCPHCQAPRAENQTFCGDCGLVFQDEESAAKESKEAAPPTVLRGRY